MVNEVTLIGNVGKEPETRQVAGGQSVASFSLATSHKWRDRDGNHKEETEWHFIECWGKLADIVSQYVTKGRQAYVKGRIKTERWEDKATGEKKSRVKIVADSVRMLGGRPSEGGKPASHEDDDIPF